MAKQKKDREDGEEKGEDTIKNTLGSLLRGYKEDHYNFIENERFPISTGSLLIDFYVNLKSGSVVRFGGPLESGKTSQSLLLLKNYLETVPKSRGLYIKGEARLSEEIQKRSGLKFVFNDADWNLGTVFVLESNVFEAMSDIVHSLLKNMFEKGERLGFIIDSLDGLILKKDLEKTAGENVQPAGVPKMTKMFFRRLALPINKYDALAILTSQYSETFKIDMYAKDKPQPVQGSGGSSVSHQPDWIFEYGVRYNSHYILEDPDAKPDPIKNKNLGHVVKITIRKSANEKSGTVMEIPIKYGQNGNSIWQSREVAEMLIMLGYVSKSKSTLIFADELIKEAKANNIEIKPEIVGEKKYYNYLEDNKEVCDFLYKKLKDIQSQTGEKVEF